MPSSPTTNNNNESSNVIMSPRQLRLWKRNKAKETTTIMDQQANDVDLPSSSTFETSPSQQLITQPMITATEPKLQQQQQHDTTPIRKEAFNEKVTGEENNNNNTTTNNKDDDSSDDDTTLEMSSSLQQPATQPIITTATASKQQAQQNSLMTTTIKDAKSIMVTNGNDNEKNTTTTNDNNDYNVKKANETTTMLEPETQPRTEELQQHDYDNPTTTMKEAETNKTQPTEKIHNVNDENNNTTNNNNDDEASNDDTTLETQPETQLPIIASSTPKPKPIALPQTELQRQDDNVMKVAETVAETATTQPSQTINNSEDDENNTTNEKNDDIETQPIATTETKEQDTSTTTKTMKEAKATAQPSSENLGNFKNTTNDNDDNKTSDTTMETKTPSQPVATQRPINSTVSEQIIQQDSPIMKKAAAATQSAQIKEHNTINDDDTGKANNDTNRNKNNNNSNNILNKNDIDAGNNAKNAQTNKKKNITASIRISECNTSTSDVACAMDENQEEAEGDRRTLDTSVNAIQMMTNGAQMIVTDVIEWLCDDIITCRARGENDRVSKWRTLRYFWNLYSTNHQQQEQKRQRHQQQQPQQHARLCTRCTLARLIVTVSHCDPYHLRDANNDAVETLAENRRSNKSHIILKPLVQWDRSQWKDFEDRLKNLHTHIVRQTKEEEDIDETASFRSDKNNHKDNGKNVGIPQQQQKKLDHIMKKIQIHKALSIFRHELELQKKKNKTNTTTTNRNNNIIRQDILNEFNWYLNSSVSDVAIKSRLMRLLRVQESGESNGPGASVTYGTISAHMDQNTNSFCLKRFQDYVENLFVRWNRDLFDKRGIPVLTRNGYKYSGNVRGNSDEWINNLLLPRKRRREGSADGSWANSNASRSSGGVDSDILNSDGKRRGKRAKQNHTQNDEGCTRGIEQLRRDREKLTGSSKDPLRECCAAAEQAKASRASSASDQPFSSGGRRATKLTTPESARTPSRTGKKKQQTTGKKLIMPSSSDSDSDDDDNGSCNENCSGGHVNKRGNGVVHLSDLPRPPPPRREQRQDDELMMDSPPSGKLRKKRRFWTDEEKDAVSEGVKLFGRGCWAEIKAEFPDVLRYRTSVQIKDCYRTMSKRGEL